MLISSRRGRLYDYDPSSQSASRTKEDELTDGRTDADGLTKRLASGGTNFCYVCRHPCQAGRRERGINSDPPLSLFFLPSTQWHLPAPPMMSPLRFTEVLFHLEDEWLKFYPTATCRVNYLRGGITILRVIYRITHFKLDVLVKFRGINPTTKMAVRRECVLPVWSHLRLRGRWN